MTATPTLTPIEARVLHEALRESWAPSRDYAIYMAALKKLEAIYSPPPCAPEAPPHRRNHRGP